MCEEGDTPPPLVESPPGWEKRLPGDEGGHRQGGGSTREQPQGTIHRGSKECGTGLGVDR